MLSGNLGAELQRGERRPANDMTVKRREGGERSRKEGLGSLSDRPREGRRGRIESIGRILKIDLSQFDKKEEEKKKEGV